MVDDQATKIAICPDAAGDRRDDDQRKDGDGDLGVVTQTKPKTKRPSLYKVLMLNDDYTPMEFVVYVLERFFNIGHERAVEIMLTVHNKGIAVVGRLSVRGRRDQGHPGHGLRAVEPASAAVHHGKGIARRPEGAGLFALEILTSAWSS